MLVPRTHGDAAMNTLLNHQFKLARRPVGMVQRGDFEYTSKAEKALAKAKEQAEEEGFDISSQLAAIEAQVEKEQLATIQNYKNEIINIIEKEIAGRYYYQRGQVQMGLRNDKEVQEAIAVLNDPARYAKLLKP